MFSFFRKKERIKVDISQISKDHCKILKISSDIQEKEIVLFLLLIYARMYRNCFSYFKLYKDGLNNIFKGVSKEQKFEDFDYVFKIEKLINIYNVGESNETVTTISLLKWPKHYSINVGYMKTTNPNLYFYCASLLLLPKINDKNKFLHCLIDLAKACDNNDISMTDGINLPSEIVNMYYR